MKLCRFQHSQGHVADGVIEGDSIHTLAQAPLSFNGPLVRTGEVVPLSGARLLAPCAPTKIVAVGLNYRAHAKEMGKALPKEPLLFLKPSTSVLDPERPILLPPESAEVHYEAELAVVIGRTAHRISPSEARQHILGYTCLNDVTARDIQRAEGQYTRAKGFDTFAPFGPWIETELDPTRLAIRGLLNGVVCQEGNTSDMIFDVYTLLAFASRVMTLLPGDILTTGTPPGVGAMKAGDSFEVVIEQIGTLRNSVVAEL